MQDILKGWLASNTVTGGNKGDKILVLESAGNLMLDDVLSEMKKENTGLRKETLAYAVDLIYSILAVILSTLQCNTLRFVQGGLTGWLTIAEQSG